MVIETFLLEKKVYFLIIWNTHSLTRELTHSLNIIFVNYAPIHYQL